MQKGAIMTAAQKERIAADLTVAFIQSGKIKSYKEATKAFHKIQEYFAPPQDEIAKPVPRKRPGRKPKTS